MESTVNLPTQEASHPQGLSGDFYHTIEDKTIPILYHLFQKIVFLLLLS